MSYGAVAGSSAAVAAAAARAARMREEEEKLSGYNKDDMDGWEFKILRANTAYFKKPDNVRRVCAEEAKAGWEMVEKFDNYRIRFKRRTDKRGNDQFLDIDPYRTTVGIGSGQMASVITGVCLLALAIIIGVVIFIKNAQ